MLSFLKRETDISILEPIYHLFVNFPGGLHRLIQLELDRRQDY